MQSRWSTGGGGGFGGGTTGGGGGTGGGTTGGGVSSGRGRAIAKSTTSTLATRAEMSDKEMAGEVKQRFELKLHKDIRDKKSGKIEVQVLVSEWPEGWKKLLKDAGFKLEDSDEGLKVVFGTIDAKMLIELAKLDFVTEIRPLED